MVYDLGPYVAVLLRLALGKLKFSHGMESQTLRLDIWRRPPCRQCPARSPGETLTM